MQTWQLQEAKSKFSEVVKRANTEGPQEITVHGQPAAVVLSIAEFAKLNAAIPPEPSWLDVLRSAKLVDGELVIERDKDSAMRDVGF